MRGVFICASSSTCAGWIGRLPAHDDVRLLATTPALLIAIRLRPSLLVGSFLNVVIHRLPIMLDREWRAQARESALETTGARTIRGHLRPATTSSCRAPPARSAAR